MIIVTGHVSVKPERLGEALTESLRHVHRSRLEPGCVSHSVQVDAEDPNRLVFFEQWADMDALKTHFGVPESGEFVRALTAMATGAPELVMYEATRL